jgi:hypothetical protein
MLEWRNRLREAVRYEKAREPADATAIGSGGTGEEENGGTDQSFEFPEQ